MRLFFIFIKKTSESPVRHIKLLLCVLFHYTADHRYLLLPFSETGR